MAKLFCCFVLVLTPTVFARAVVDTSESELHDVALNITSTESTPVDAYPSSTAFNTSGSELGETTPKSYTERTSIEEPQAATSEGVDSTTQVTPHFPLFPKYPHGGPLDTTVWIGPGGQFPNLGQPSVFALGQQRASKLREGSGTGLEESNSESEDSNQRDSPVSTVEDDSGSKSDEAPSASELGENIEAAKNESSTDAPEPTSTSHRPSHRGRGSSRYSARRRGNVRYSGSPSNSLSAGTRGKFSTASARSSFTSTPTPVLSNSSTTTPSAVDETTIESSHTSDGEGSETLPVPEVVQIPEMVQIPEIIQTPEVVQIPEVIRTREVVQIPEVVIIDPTLIEKSDSLETPSPSLEDVPSSVQGSSDTKVEEATSLAPEVTSQSPSTENIPFVNSH